MLIRFPAADRDRIVALVCPTELIQDGHVGNLAFGLVLLISSF